MAEYPNFYENMDEVNFRLVGTVVTYDKKPAYIHRASNHADGVIRLHISILPNQLDREDGEDEADDVVNEQPRTVRKIITSPKFNMFRPFKLGFINDFSNGPHTSYTSRLPARRSKQGLHSEAFTSKSIGSVREGRVDFIRTIRGQPFADMVSGVYPSLEETLDTLHENASIGLDREFAVARDGLGLDFLYNKTDRVGIVRQQEVLLANRFGYLRESIINCSALPNNVSNL